MFFFCASLEVILVSCTIKAGPILFYICVCFLTCEMILGWIHLLLASCILFRHNSADVEVWFSFRILHKHEGPGFSHSQTVRPYFSREFQEVYNLYNPRFCDNICSFLRNLTMACFIEEFNVCFWLKIFCKTSLISGPWSLNLIIKSPCFVVRVHFHSYLSIEMCLNLKIVSSVFYFLPAKPLYVQTSNRHLNVSENLIDI